MPIGIGTPTQCESCGTAIVKASRWQRCGDLGEQQVYWWIEWPAEIPFDAAMYDVPVSKIVDHTHERCERHRAAVLTTPVSGSEPV